MKEHLFAVGIIVFFVVLGMMSAQSAFGKETHGRGSTLDKAVENSHVAAHLRCNRQGLWADLDNLRVIKVEKKGKKKAPEHVVHVNFSCTPDYAKHPTN